MSQTPDPANGAWHLDKRIPLALIGAILMQTAAFGYWVGQISIRLDGTVELNNAQEQRLAAVESAANAQAVNAATTSAQLTAVRESLAEMKEAQAETNRLLRDIVRGSKP